LGMEAIENDLSVPTPTLSSEKCIEVAAGEVVSLAVTESGSSFSWGMGTNGQLGNGSEDDLLEPSVVRGEQLENRRVISASAGGQHTILLAMDKVAEAFETTTSPTN